MNVSYDADGLHVSDPVTTLSMCCEAHPCEPYPHDGCPGPGAPLSHRDRLLRDVLTDLRVAAAFGDETAARWLQRRGIDEHTWKDDR